MLSQTFNDKICKTLSEIDEADFLLLFKKAYGLPDEITDDPLYPDKRIKQLYNLLHHAAQEKDNMNLLLTWLSML